MKKRISILMAILILVVFCAMFLMSQIIIEQNKELTSLRQRTHNLEVIVSYELGNLNLAREKPKS